MPCTGGRDCLTRRSPAALARSFDASTSTTTGPAGLGKPLLAKAPTLPFGFARPGLKSEGRSLSPSSGGGTTSAQRLDARSTISSRVADSTSGSAALTYDGLGLHRTYEDVRVTGPVRRVAERTAASRRSPPLAAVRGTRAAFADLPSGTLHSTPVTPAISGSSPDGEMSEIQVPCCVTAPPGIRIQGDSWLCPPNDEVVLGASLPSDPVTNSPLPPGPLGGKYAFEVYCGHSGPCSRCSVRQFGMMAHNANSTLVSSLGDGLQRLFARGRINPQTGRRRRRGDAFTRPRTGQWFHDAVNSNPCCEPTAGATYLHNIDAPGPFVNEDGGQPSGDLVFSTCVYSESGAVCPWQYCCVDFQIEYRPGRQPRLRVLARLCMSNSGVVSTYPPPVVAAYAPPSPLREGFPEDPHEGIDD